MSLSDLPALNATLNAIAAAFLAVGYVMIRRRERTAHRWCMTAAFVASTFFLTSYLIYHANAGAKLYAGTGPIRLMYFIILGTHVVLAAVILPMAIVTLARALRGRFDLHKRLARWTLPLWIYVSVTGVVIYLMLY
jgi:putative membrane protein